MIGKRLAHYEITRHLGSGGMGAVYEASDSKLGRSVAIKILPDEFSRDQERRQRFDREARVLASLNHPHIATIYGFETTASTTFIVMELVEGETLAERIYRGPIPVEEALTLARQITEALESAHEKGIVHRDLKPSNIKLSREGEVKILDFGLAKALENESAADLSNSPTISNMATGAGIILGTAAYMSPEQARGKEVDRRTDIFAFGCVLYEMLTGRKPFEGETVTEILAAIMKSDPDWSRLPADTSPGFRRMLRRCLEKDRRRRFQHAGDIRIEIEDADVEPTAVAVPSGRRAVLPWIVSAVLAISLISVILRSTWTVPAQPNMMRLDIVTPSTSDPISFALSPDGRWIVFVASGDGPSRLWLRALDSATAQPMFGTEGASFPFWSPDNRSIAFFAGGKLKRTDIGGATQPLADASLGRGGNWGPDGVILFAPTGTGPIFRVPASGGTATAVTKLATGQTSHRFPVFLPDGRRFLFPANGQSNVGVYVGSLDSVEVRRLMDQYLPVAYFSPNQLLGVQQGSLLAWPFDAARAEITGSPVTIATPIGADTISATAAFSVSASGLIAYRSEISVRRQLSWFDRTGKPLGAFGEPDENGLANPELSPDGKRVAVDRITQNNIDIWILESMRQTKLTFDAGQDSLPVWSKDGRIAFRSNRRGVLDLFEMSSSSAGSDEALLITEQYKDPQGYSPDDRYLLYSSGGDLWLLPRKKGEKPLPFLNTPAEERVARFSPDGRWVAYRSNESSEIYVRPFPPGPGGQWQVSQGGGNHPRWARTGDELYYLAPDGKLMAVSIASKGDTLEPGTPVVLFQPRIVTTTTSPYRAQYDVAPDGRFLINTVADDGPTSPITLLVNSRRESN